MNSILIARIAGAVCLIAGLLFTLDFTVIGSLLRNNPQFREYIEINLARTILWAVISVGLAFAPIGLMALGVTGTKWKKFLGNCGTFLIVMGAASYIVGTTFVYNFPNHGTRQIFTPLGSILLTVGMLKIAVAVLFANIWSGWQKLPVFLVALYFPLQFPLQAIIFLGQSRGPNPFILGAWGLFWAVLGLTIWLSAGDVSFIRLRQQRV